MSYFGFAAGRPDLALPLRLRSLFFMALFLIVLWPSSSWAQNNEAFGNAFSRPRKAATPAASQTPPFQNPQEMIDHVRTVTGAVGGVEDQPPAVRKRQEFFRKSAGLPVTPSAAVDPQAKVVESLRPSQVEVNPSSFFEKSSPQLNSKITISAFVPTQPKARAERALEQIRSLQQRTGIGVGNVVLVGPTSHLNLAAFDFADLPFPQFRAAMRKNNKLPAIDFAEVEKKIKAQTPKEARLFKEVGLTVVDAPRSDNLLRDLNIKTLPAWIIETNGNFHIFEGEYEPNEFFDASGAFIANRW